MRKLLSAIAAIALVGWASVAAAPATLADDPSPAITAPDHVYDNLGIPSLPLPKEMAFVGMDLISGQNRAISVTAGDDNCDTTQTDDSGKIAILTGCAAVKLDLSGDSGGKLTIPASPGVDDGTAAGGAIVYQSTNGDGTGTLIQIDGTADQLNQALATLIYTPEDGYRNDVGDPADMLVSLTDGSTSETVTQDVYIRVDYLNQPPSLTVPADQDVAANSTTVLPPNSGDAPVFTVSDPDAYKDDLLLIVSWTTCGTFSLTGEQFNGGDSIKGLLQEPALNLPSDVVDAITSVLPSDIPSTGFDTGHPDDTHTAFAGLADLEDLSYALSQVTFNAPATAGTCSLWTLVDDLGNRGLPAHYISGTPGYEIPVPEFAVHKVVFSVAGGIQISVPKDITVNGGVTAHVPVSITSSQHPRVHRGCRLGRRHRRLRHGLHPAGRDGRLSGLAPPDRSTSRCRRSPTTRPSTARRP